MNAFLGVSFRSDPGQRGSRRNHPANPSPKQTPTHELNDLAKLYLTPRTHTPLCRSSPQRVPGLLFRNANPFLCHVNDRFAPKRTRNETRGGGGSAERHRPSAHQDTAKGSPSGSWRGKVERGVGVSIPN